jgi:hypothetical protein
MTYPGSGGPGWPGDPAGERPQPADGGQSPAHPSPGPHPQPPFQAPAPTVQMPAVAPPYGPHPSGYAPPTPAYAPRPGAYGQPGGYGPQPPVPPGYPPPYGPQPPPPGGNKAPLIAAVVVLLLIAGGVTAFFLLRGDGKPKPKPGPSATVSAPASPGFPSSASAPSGSSFPSDTAGPTDTTGGSIDESDARQIVQQYLDDINSQDRTDAQTLICTALVSSWRQKIDQSGGDFTVKVTDSTFETSTQQTESLDLKYTLSVKAIDSGQTGTSEVTFKVVEESGLKICGEK